jgi:hypothetical protein
MLISRQLLCERDGPEGPAGIPALPAMHPAGRAAGCEFSEKIFRHQGRLSGRDPA